MENRYSEWKGGDVCEKLRKRMIDVRYLQEVRWREQGARMLGMNGRTYKLWWSGKGDGIGGVGVLEKEQLCEMVVEVRKVSDRVMTFVVIFEDFVLRLICGYALQSGRSLEEKSLFTTSRNASGICILQMIQLCAMMISMEMLIGILMDSMECMKGMA